MRIIIEIKTKDKKKNQKRTEKEQKQSKTGHVTKNFEKLTIF